MAVTFQIEQRMQSACAEVEGPKTSDKDQPPGKRVVEALGKLLIVIGNQSCPRYPYNIDGDSQWNRQNQQCDAAERSGAHQESQQDTADDEGRQRVQAAAGFRHTKSRPGQLNHVTVAKHGNPKGLSGARSEVGG